MRTVQIPGRQYKDTIRVLDGILWATNRQGTRSWKSDNVPVTIQAYLLDRGASNEIFNLGRIRYLLTMLQKLGYGHKTLRGRRVIKWEFAADIDLRPSELPEFVGKEKGPVDKEIQTSFGSSVTFDADEDTQLPIPVVVPPPPPRYRAEDLDIRLDKFAAQDGELYSTYVDKLITALDSLIVE